MGRQFHRRRLLRRTALVSAFTIAGCPLDTPGEDTPTPDPSTGQDRSVLEIWDVDVSGDRLLVGEQLTIIADVQNTGDVEGKFEINLRIGEESVASQVVELDAKEGTKITLTHVFNQSGEYNVSLNEKELGTLSVIEGFTEFVSVDGQSITVNDERQYLIGANNCCSLTSWNPKERIDELLNDMAELGLNCLRIRGYGCNTQRDPDVCFQYEPGKYGEYAFEVMDYLVREAHKKGIRLVIDLCNAWNVNTGGDIAQYVEWSSTANEHDDFFTDEECRDAYKEYVEHVITRENEYTGRAYRDEPAIAVWSLCNEIHAKNGGAKADVQAWIDEMARFVKELDVNQLVTPGHLGYYQDDEADEIGIDFIENHRSPDIDICTFRVYNQNVGFQSHQEPRDEWLEINEDRVLPWITDHVEAVYNELDKPVMVEEWGWKADRTADDAERQIELRKQIYESWIDRFIELDVDGSLIWSMLTDEAYESWGYEKWFALSHPQDRETLEIVSEYANHMRGNPS